MTHSLPLSRPLSIAAPALLLTAALFVLMQWLIATQEAAIESTPPIQFNAIVLPKPIPEPPPPHPRQAPEPKAPPQATLRTDPGPAGTTGLKVSLRPVTMVGPKSRPTRLGSGALVPFLRVPPSYPGYAVNRGIEGYVDLAFTVTPAGRTADIEVIGGQPQGVFDRAAVKAVAQWKYRPRMVDGQPIATRNVRTRVRFELQK